MPITSAAAAAADQIRHSQRRLHDKTTNDYVDTTAAKPGEVFQSGDNVGSAYLHELLIDYKQVYSLRSAQGCRNGF